MSAGCSCDAEVLRWIDAFQNYGPIARWRQYQASPERAAVRSDEMRRIKVDERAALIRWQIDHIWRTCDHGREATA